MPTHIRKAVISYLGGSRQADGYVFGANSTYAWALGPLRWSLIFATIEGYFNINQTYDQLCCFCLNVFCSSPSGDHHLPQHTNKHRQQQTALNQTYKNKQRQHTHRCNINNTQTNKVITSGELDLRVAWALGPHQAITMFLNDKREETMTTTHNDKYNKVITIFLSPTFVLLLRLASMPREPE